MMNADITLAAAPRQCQRVSKVVSPDILTKFQRTVKLPHGKFYIILLTIFASAPLCFGHRVCLSADLNEV